MGLPEVQISFQSKAAQAVSRSERGIVALILEEGSPTHTFIEYSGIEEVAEGDWNEENYDLIKLAFKDAPFKVMIETIDTDAQTPRTISDVLDVLKKKKWNYLATPYVTTTSDVSTFIKSQRDNNKKTFKAVLANETADHEGVINVTTDNIQTKEKTYTTAQYTVRLAGVFASLPFTRSSTYYVLDDVVSVDDTADPDAAIDNGELILIDDGEKVKIGRGVNSLTSTTPEKNEQFTKITVIDKLDMLRDDIRNTFNDDYVGKTANTYDDKMLFFGAINAYFSRMIREGVLDPSGENRSDINLTKQKSYLQGTGVDVANMTNQEIREYNTGSTVFGKASVRVTDAMEDLEFDLAI